MSIGIVDYLLIASGTEVLFVSLDSGDQSIEIAVLSNVLYFVRREAPSAPLQGNLYLS